MTKDGEESHIGAILKASDVCIDVGAYVGDYTHLFAKLVGSSGRVLAVEPVQSSYRMLSNRVKLFDLRNVECINVALSEAPGQPVEMVGGQSRPGLRARAHLWATGDTANPSGQSVPMTTVDALVASRGLERVDFVKCDVEGAELLVFRGAIHTLTTYQPIVFCEIEDRWMRYGYSSADVTEFFANLGFSMFVSDGRQLLPTETIRPGYNNYFFYPRHRSLGG